jgi:hypothetical protein
LYLRPLGLDSLLEDLLLTLAGALSEHGLPRFGCTEGVLHTNAAISCLAKAIPDADRSI